MADITIYTTDTCPHCTTAKEYLKEKGIDFIEKNVQKDESARNELIQKGYTGVPLIIIGDEEIEGFNKEKIDSLIG